VDEALGVLEIGIRDGLVYGLLALGLVLVYKGTRILNFAHPYFGLQCAFLCWWLTSKASFPPFSWLPFQLDTKPRFVLAALIALTLTGLNGWAIEHSIMRKLRGAPRLVSLVATIALAQGTVGFVLLLFNRTEEQANTSRTLPSVIDASIEFGTRFVTGADLQVLILAPLVCGALALFFKLSPFGIAIRAAAENSESARLLGISVSKVSVFTWVVGSLLAGLAGILITEVRGSLDISTLSTGFLVRGLASALVGGLTSLPGAMAGGLIVGMAESILRELTNDQPGVPETLLFGIIIAFLLFRPGGLFGAREETEDKVAFIPTLRALPRRLQGSPAVKALRVVGVMFAAFAVGISMVTGSRTNGTLVVVVVYAIVGVSLTVLMGYTGQISLGHWGLVGVGAFTMANLYTRLTVPFLIALPFTVLIGMYVALLIGLPALRIRGLYLAVATLAFNLAAEFFIFKSRLVGGGSAGIIVDPPKLGPLDLDDPSNRPMFFFALVMLGLSMLVARNLARSRTGRGFFALRENEKAAATLGVDLTRYKLLSFAISGGIAALAGAVYVTYLGFAEPTTWTTQTSLTLVSLVMIGGLGSLSGSILGALVVFGLPNLIEFENPWIVPIGTGILLIVVITRARGGLAGLQQRIREGIVVTVDDLANQKQQPPPSAAAPPPATTTA
jgi:branched-chain amino acid transport system permease protein